MNKRKRLVLISNREPYIRKKSSSGVSFHRSMGGLVTALDPVMRRIGGVWLASESDGRSKEGHRFQVPEAEPTYTLRQIPLSSSELRGYYYGFANRALWPLCHYSIDRCHFEESQWREYFKVNERFAQAAAQEAGEDDLIWVHDYHFCLLPKMIRDRRPDGRLAYFLHIPFPAQEVFRVLPWRREILEGMLGADLVGVHIERYVHDFLCSCEVLLDAKVDYANGIVFWQGRQVKVAAFPIGIDVNEIEVMAATGEAGKKARAIRKNLGDARLLVGVDRLDYSKGIPQRLAALERFLERWPEFKGKVTLVQLAVPSRTRVPEYKELKRTIDELVGRINGRFGDSSWQPIRYLYRSLGRQDLIAHYLAADVGVITPLRDGMNLVAKEYCAAKLDSDGALVLSELTGAARGLGCGALLVNPFSVEDTATALKKALSMDKEERYRRMNAMREHVKATDINVWLQNILTKAMGEDEVHNLLDHGGFTS